MSARYRVIVPVQSPQLALPRSGMPPEVRSSLARAFAIDTLHAISRCRLVRDLVVVSPDPDAAALSDAVGAAFVQVAGGTELNAAVDDAFHRGHQPSDQMVAAIVSDLPALSTAEVEDVLRAASRRNSTFHVTDLGNRQITMQVERASTFTSCLAVDRTRRHAPRGTAVTPLLPGLRGDVDTYAGLRIATHMGVGSATRRALDELGSSLMSRAEAV